MAVVCPTAASVIDPDPALTVSDWPPLIAPEKLIGLSFELRETAPPEREAAPVKVRPS
jgi:hypothetical protein